MLKYTQQMCEFGTMLYQHLTFAVILVNKILYMAGINKRLENDISTSVQGMY